MQKEQKKEEITTTKKRSTMNPLGVPATEPGCKPFSGRSEYAGGLQPVC